MSNQYAELLLQSVRIGYLDAERVVEQLVKIIDEDDLIKLMETRGWFDVPALTVDLDS